MTITSLLGLIMPKPLSFDGERATALYLEDPTRTYADVARLLGAGYGNVARYLRGSGIPRNTGSDGRSHRVSREAVVAAYRAGPETMTFKELGERFGVSYVTISKIIKQSGVPVKLSANGRVKPKRECIGCGVVFGGEIPRSWFSPNRCEPCGRVAQAHWFRKKRYGMGPDDHQAMLIAQNGACAICEQVPDKPLIVDHDHVTGKVRGLLCWNCNVGLGRFSDNLDGLRRAVKYLEQAELTDAV